MTIYFIQEGEHGPIKIGYTAGSGEARLRSLQSGNPRKLRLISTRYGTYKDERALHRRHARDRLVGEWFTPTLNVLNEATEGRAASDAILYALDLPEGKRYRSAGPPAATQRPMLDHQGQCN